ncbi:hypothetical protein BGX31_008217 [Mortierella sp. GBA43]|nr:hypothetical protein BGX31_008217 [Mortierella sp. GBA43]
MLRADSFIAFTDPSPQGHFLWLSPSVYDILGYEPEELIGRPGYEVICPDDHADTKEFRKEYVMNDLIASQIVIRFTTKDGRSFPGVAVVSFCYDFIIASVNVLDSSAGAHLQQRAHSNTMNHRVGSKKEEFERLRRHHRAFAENSWNLQAMEPEQRVCLIINRFERSLTIIYASSPCEKVLHVDPDDITGKPILLYIRSDDLAPFVEQVNLIKATTTISQMRFWFQSPNWPHEIPCEAIVFGASDGIVAVIRRCKPFVRKHFITSMEYFESSSSSASSRWFQSCGISPMSVETMSPPSPMHEGYGSNEPSPPRNLPWETLHRIKILDLDDEMPLQTCFSESNRDTGFGNTSPSGALPFQEVIAEDYCEEDDEWEDDGVGAVVRGVAISRLDGNHGI